MALPTQKNTLMVRFIAILLAVTDVVCMFRCGENLRCQEIQPNRNKTTKTLRFEVFRPIEVVSVLWNFAQKWLFFVSSALVDIICRRSQLPVRKTKAK